VALAREKGLKFTIGYSQRFNPKFAYVRKAIREGAIGRPVSALVSRHITRNLGKKISGRVKLSPAAWDIAETARAAEFFRLITPTVMELDSRSAELAKLFCNMYRYIDFAVSNEFMMIAAQHGREVYPIIDAVNRGYKRGGIKSPGLAGGPCLYKDGFFLINKIPYNELIASAWKIHETTPAYLVEQARTHKPIDGAKAAVLGLAFKRDIDDPRNSLAYKLRKILLAEGADVHLHDPLIASESLAEHPIAAERYRAILEKFEADPLEPLLKIAPPDRPPTATFRPAVAQQPVQARRSRRAPPNRSTCSSTSPRGGRREQAQAGARAVVPPGHAARAGEPVVRLRPGHAGRSPLYRAVPCSPRGGDPGRCAGSGRRRLHASLWRCCGATAPSHAAGDGRAARQPCRRSLPGGARVAA
jgi:hypothetical protein